MCLFWPQTIVVTVCPSVYQTLGEEMVITNLPDCPVSTVCLLFRPSPSGLFHFSLPCWLVILKFGVLLTKLKTKWIIWTFLEELLQEYIFLPINFLQIFHDSWFYEHQTSKNSCFDNQIIVSVSLQARVSKICCLLNVIFTFVSHLWWLNEVFYSVK